MKSPEEATIELLTKMLGCLERLEGSFEKLSNRLEEFMWKDQPPFSKEIRELTVKLRSAVKKMGYSPLKIYASPNLKSFLGSVFFWNETDNPQSREYACEVFEASPDVDDDYFFIEFAPPMKRSTFDLLPQESK